MKISNRLIFFGLCGLILFLLFMHHRFPSDDGNILHRELYRFFDLDGEGNFPTWISGSLLLASALLSLLGGWFSRELDLGKPFSQGCFLMFLLFTFLSFDEISGFHESLTYVVGVKWVYLYFPFFVVVSVLLWFSWSKSGSPEKSFFLSTYFGLLIFAAGGLLLEWIYYRFGPPLEFINRFKFRIEEGLELFGAVVIFTSMLRCIETLYSSWKKRYIS